MDKIKEYIEQMYYQKWRESEYGTLPDKVSGLNEAQREDFDNACSGDIEIDVKGLEKIVVLLCKTTAKNVRHKAIDLNNEKFGALNGVPHPFSQAWNHANSAIMRIQFNDVKPK